MTECDGSQRPRLPLAGVAALVVSLIAACGSTVEQRAVGGAVGPGAVDQGLGLGSATDAESGQVLPETTQPGGVQPGGTATLGDPAQVADGQSEPAPVAVGGREEQPTAAGGPGPSSGRGFDAKTIRLGFGYIADDSAAVLGAYGLKGLDDAGDARAQADAVVRDINARGGVAGRKVTLVPVPYDTAEVVNNPNAAGQKACATATEDNTVVAMLLTQVSNENARACFHARGVPIVNSGGENPHVFRADYRRYPLYVNAGGMLGDRLFSGVVDRLVARKFFVPWDTTRGAAGGTAPVKIGALVLENSKGTLPTYRARLAKYGLKIDQVQELPEEISAAITAGQSAVLRFRSEGITHVLGITVPFANTAEQQGYRPRYFVNCCPNIVAQSSPPAQMNGAMAESFAPTFDVAEAQDPGPPSAATTHCYTVMTKAGMRPSNQTMRASMQSICDTLYVSKAAGDATGDLSTQGFMRGVQSLGSTFQSATTWVSFFGPGEQSSARVLRDLAFRADCTCFAFVDKVNHRIS